jgi:phage FluMu protein gp41
VLLRELRGTTQNDVLKEYIARGNLIYPPEGTMWLTADSSRGLRAMRRGFAGAGGVPNPLRARADVAGRFSTRPSGRAACRNRRDEVSGA